ncbi:unnamed protein product [Lupinus luteus]|uniref:PPM-type phosphatase domain-containing protein n=1 Tax=Lupinus luteus TaxID=3873 RepID=A0AAV1XBH1_LUPLU
MPSTVEMSLRVGNSVCDKSIIAAHMDVSRHKIMADAGFLSNSITKFSTEAVIGSEEDHNGCNMSDGLCIAAAVLMPPKQGGRRGDPIIDSSCSLSVVGENSSVCGDELMVTYEGIADLGTTSSVDIDKSNCAVSVIARAADLAESNVEADIMSETLALAVSLEEEKGIRSSPTPTTVVHHHQIPMKKRVSGTVCRSAFELDCIPLWGFTSLSGKRPEMEDAVAAVVNYCRDRLHLALSEEIKFVKEGLIVGKTKDDCQDQWKKAFTNCFLKVDAVVGGSSNCNSVAPENVGSAAVVAVICSSHIIVSNCGDSRAVLCHGKEPMALSVDHKPNRDDEHARIEAAGGKVIQWNGHRVLGVLAMSRSIGMYFFIIIFTLCDRYPKPWIIPEPEVSFLPRAKDDECLILASDGPWDVMTNEEACHIARRRIFIWHNKNGSALPSVRGEEIDPAAQAAAEYLLNCALQKGSKDNITVIVVDLKAQRKFKTRT